MNERRTGGEWDAERVQALREWLQESQTELARRVGTRQQTISEWETGASRPRRMSRRLLGMVAEESGYYSAEAAGAEQSTGEPPPESEPR